MAAECCRPRRSALKQQALKQLEVHAAAGDAEDPQEVRALHAARAGLLAGAVSTPTLLRMQPRALAAWHAAAPKATSTRQLRCRHTARRCHASGIRSQLAAPESSQPAESARLQALAAGQSTSLSMGQVVLVMLRYSAAPARGALAFCAARVGTAVRSALHRLLSGWPVRRHMLLGGVRLLEWPRLPACRGCAGALNNYTDGGHLLVRSSGKLAVILVRRPCPCCWALPCTCSRCVHVRPLRTGCRV